MDLYKWRSITFVKTDRNGQHLLECGKGLYFCNFEPPLAKVGPPWRKIMDQPEHYTFLVYNLRMCRMER